MSKRYISNGTNFDILTLISSIICYVRYHQFNSTWLLCKCSSWNCDANEQWSSCIFKYQYWWSTMNMYSHNTADQFISRLCFSHAVTQWHTLYHADFRYLVYTCSLLRTFKKQTELCVVIPRLYQHEIQRWIHSTVLIDYLGTVLKIEKMFRTKQLKTILNFKKKKTLKEF